MILKKYQIAFLLSIPLPLLSSQEDDLYTRRAMGAMLDYAVQHDGFELYNLDKIKESKAYQAATTGKEKKELLLNAFRKKKLALLKKTLRSYLLNSFLLPGSVFLVPLLLLCIFKFLPQPNLITKWQDKKMLGEGNLFPGQRHLIGFFASLATIVAWWFLPPRLRVVGESIMEKESEIPTFMGELLNNEGDLLPALVGMIGGVFFMGIGVFIEYIKKNEEFRKFFLQHYLKHCLNISLFILPVIWVMSLILQFRSRYLIPWQLYQGNILPEDRFKEEEEQYIISCKYNEYIELSAHLKQQVEYAFLQYRQGKVSRKDIYFTYLVTSFYAAMTPEEEGQMDEATVDESVKTLVKYFPQSIQKKIRNMVSLYASNIPSKALMLQGAPGTGKTELAKQLGKALNGNTMTVQLEKVDHIERLIGTEDEPGLLALEAIKSFSVSKKPVKVLLFDEVDKVVRHNYALLITLLTLLDDSKEGGIYFPYFEVTVPLRCLVILISNRVINDQDAIPLYDRVESIHISIENQPAFIDEVLIPEFSKSFDVELLQTEKQAIYDAVKLQNCTSFRTIRAIVQEQFIHIKQERRRKNRSLMG